MAGIPGPTCGLGPHLPLVWDAEVTCQLLCTLVVATKDEVGNCIV